MPRSHNNNPHLDEYTSYKMAQEEDPEMALFNRMFESGADDTAYQAVRDGVPEEDAFAASAMMGGGNEYDTMFAANMPAKPSLFPASGAPRSAPAYRPGEDQRHTNFLNSGAAPDTTTPQERDMLAAVYSGNTEQPQSFDFGAEEALPVYGQEAVASSIPLPPEAPPPPTGFNFDTANPAEDESFAAMLAGLGVETQEGPSYEMGTPQIIPSKPDRDEGFWL